MSGSVGASRIEHSAVEDTVKWFEQNILKPYPYYRSLKLSGSVNQVNRKDHGDIDVVVCVKGDNLRDAKKSFEHYLSKCVELLPFKSGKNRGKKVQTYGNIITCQIPIQGFEGLAVQVDCDLALSEKEQEFKTNFLDLSGEKQCLLSGLVRISLLEEDSEKVFKRLHLHPKFDSLTKNQELEFVLNENGLFLRKVTYENGKELNREILWTSRDWSDVKKLLNSYDLNEDFYKILDQIDKIVKTPRARKRIVGIIKAGVNISAGEQNTPKGDEKERAIKTASEKLENLDEESIGSKNTVALYAGGFKPPHKAHFDSAKKLYSKADRLIVFIGSKLRSGIPVTADQSKSIWNIYSTYLKQVGKPIEIRISSGSPVQDVFNMVTNPDSKEYLFLIGKSIDDEDRYKELKQYPNVKLVDLPTITSKEDQKLSASTLRQSLDTLRKGDWLPNVLDREDAKKILDIIVKPLEQEVIKEEIRSKTRNVLSKFVEEEVLKEALVVGPEGKIGGSENRICFQAYIRLTVAEEPYQNPMQDENIVDDCVEAFNQLSKGRILITDYQVKHSKETKHTIWEFTVDCEQPAGEGEDLQTYGGPKSIALNLFRYFFQRAFEVVEIGEWADHEKYYSLECTGFDVKSIVILQENSTGAPIAPSSILSSENREKLGKFYEDLQTRYGSEFYIKFNQTFILIKCPDQEKLADFYEKLSNIYKADFNFKNVRDAIQIKTKYKSDWMTFNTDDGSGTYRDNSGNGGFDYMQDQAEHWIEESQNTLLTNDNDKDLAFYLASYLDWIHKNKGVGLDSLPQISLVKGGQNLKCPMKDKSGSYDPENNKILIYGDGRTLKEMVRTGAHEISHWIQNKEGKLKNIDSSNIKDSEHLKKIELEANNQAYEWFREWTESLPTDVER